MTRTPDEIKKGLECHARPCGCDMGCPYVEECSEDEGCPMSADAIAYISRLESQNRCFKEIKESCERRMIDMAQRVPSWISVKERLPERDKEVLCFFVYPDSTTVCQNVYYGNGHWLGEGSFVTHWMPLPEPPEEE